MTKDTMPDEIYIGEKNMDVRMNNKADKYLGKSVRYVRAQPKQSPDCRVELGIIKGQKLVIKQLEERIAALTPDSDIPGQDDPHDVRALREAIDKLTGIPAMYGFCEPVEGYLARPQDLERVLHEMGKAARQAASHASSDTVAAGQSENDDFIKCLTLLGFDHEMDNGDHVVTGMGFEKRHTSLRGILSRLNGWLAARAAGQAAEKQSTEDDNSLPWFINDGDLSGLQEFIEHMDWDYFRKGGKDKNGHFLVFLIKDEESVAAIKSIGNKRHLLALEILRGAE